MTPLARRRLWFALFVAVVFALGVGTGLTVGRLFRPGHGFGRPGHPGPPGPPPSPAAMADRMGRELELDPDQKTRIEAVFRRGAERFEQFHAVTGREFEALRQELNTEIERELTPEQRARFRQLGAGPRGHHPPPPPPPPR
jgi:hypothetical protein